MIYFVHFSDLFFLTQKTFWLKTMLKLYLLLCIITIINGGSISNDDALSSINKILSILENDNLSQDHSMDLLSAQIEYLLNTHFTIKLQFATNPKQSMNIFFP